MKFKSTQTNQKRQSKKISINDKELNSESSDQLYLPQSDCSYRNFLKQQSYDQSSNYNSTNYNQLDYGQRDEANIDMPHIGTISKQISGKEDEDCNVDVNLVKFVNDEEEAHEKRNQLCKDLLRQCQEKIFEHEIDQCKNQLLLEKQEQMNEENKLIDCNGDCVGQDFNNFDSNQTSELNSPSQLSNELSNEMSSCSDELTCKEASNAILSRMNNLEYKSNNCQD